MALIDTAAAHELIDLRTSQGLSPEDLAEEIKRYVSDEPWGRRGAVDAHTIRRIERTGHVPGDRVRFVLAAYFELRPDQLWRSGRAREAVAA